ncbi:MAG TPA: hypothetical protein VMW83_12270 [Spirochaetia bacterium]|nr:hypothetical protein [Spirochaetia bacterium]
MYDAGKVMAVPPEMVTIKALADSVQMGMAENGMDLEELLAGLRDGCNDYDTD